MSFFGTKVPMERTANGFRRLLGDDLLENVVQFFMGTYAAPVGDAGEIVWDHTHGTPWEMLRHRNVRAGTVERYVAITVDRFRTYAGDFIGLTTFERDRVVDNELRMRWGWRNKMTGNVPEEPTDVQFAE